MKNLKIGLWIFIILLLQTVLVSRIHIFGASASLAAGYIICVTVMENEFRDTMIICIIASVLAGALSGRSFAVVTLFYVYSSIAVFALRKKPRYIGAFPKILAWTFICSGILEIILFVISEWTLTAEAVLYTALPTATVNTVLAALIYPALKRTMYKEEKEKLLIA